MSEEIKEVVKKTYTDVVKANESCCGGSSSCSPAQEVGSAENYSNLEGYMKDADLGLGCGIPTEFAKIKQGDTVLDLGSGAGNDVFVARSIVGESGKVIGLDMTEAMLEKANENKAKLGYENVEFMLGEIESLPISDNTIDVVVSNCVMNLVPDKVKAYSEVWRVLKPGGNFSISDIVINGTLPDGIRNAAAMYAGCVAGAMSKEDYIDAIKDAGFTNVEVVKEREINVPDMLLLQYTTAEELADYKVSGGKVLSVTVYARKD